MSAPVSIRAEHLLPSIQSFLAFDFGTRRVGGGERQTPRFCGRASRLTHDHRQGRRAICPPSKRCCANGSPMRWWSVCRFHPDGAASTTIPRRAQPLRPPTGTGRFRLPVHEVDERYTTTEALSAGARDADARRPQHVDAASTAILSATSTCVMSLPGRIRKANDRRATSPMSTPSLNEHTVPWTPRRCTPNCCAGVRGLLTRRSDRAGRHLVRRRLVGRAPAAPIWACPARMV